MYYVYRKGLTDGRNSFDRDRSRGRRKQTGAVSQSRASTQNGQFSPSRTNNNAAGTQGAPGRRGGQPRVERRGGMASRGQNRGKNRGQYIDPTKFVNRAVETEAPVRFVPDHKFADFAVDARLKHNIAKKGYETPTPIQDKAIPHVLRGSDIVGLANTGTGKTGAFLVPLIDKVLRNKAEHILVVAPTRELAIQIEDEFRGFADGLGMTSACLVGGAPMGKQISELRRRPNFVIGTPGRIKDHIERKFLDLSRFGTIVLDEADRMLDMGFIADMRYLMSLMPLKRHTLFFSATMSKEIESLIHEFLREPVTVSVKVGDTSKNVDQDVVKLAPGQDKLDVLHDLLIQPEFSKVLIFGRTKHGVEKLSKLLQKRGFRAESIHGNKTHPQRQKALSRFKGNEAQVLIATDVAARGLDISGVSHVINFDIPTTYDDYVHRIGRTGRGDNKGKALTFIDHDHR